MFREEMDRNGVEAVLTLAWVPPSNLGNTRHGQLEANVNFEKVRMKNWII